MINMNLNQRRVIETVSMKWERSPASGVWRKPLEREEKESGHTTSVVRYEAGAGFPEHAHPLGEEILVLEGIFSDETGDYGPGNYLRNPPGSRHQPFSKEGCTILVKLNQFDAKDLQVVRLDSLTQPWPPGLGGLEVMSLHNFGHEHVALVKWPAGEYFPMHRHFGGEEIFVLSGEFRDEHGLYPAGTWIRSPHGSTHSPFVEEETLIWVKTGHLPLD